MALSIVNVTTNSGNSASPSVPKPTGVTTDDVLLVFLHINGPQDSSDNNGSTPFTAKLTNREYNGPSAQLDLYHRVAGGSEPSTYNFTLDGSNRWAVTCVAIRGADTSTIYDVSPSASSENTGTGATNTTNGITTLTDGAEIFAVAVNDSNSVSFSATPGGWTVHSNLSGTQLSSVVSKNKATAGAESAISWTQSTSNGTWLNNIFAIKPAASTSTESVTKSLTYAVVTIPSAITKSLTYSVVDTPSAITKSLKYTVLSTPTAITKSLEYVINVAVSIAKSLTYKIIGTPSAVTKSLTYAVTTTASAITKSLAYAVDISPSAITKSLQYTVQAAPSAITKSLQYTLDVGTETFGTTSVGAAGAAINDDIYGTGHTAPESGEILKLSIYTKGAGTNFKGIVLDSSKNILGVGSVVNSVANGWIDSTFATSIPITAGQTYYLCLIAQSAADSWAMEYSGGSGWYDSSNSYASPTDPTDGSSNSMNHSIYATYVPTPSTSITKSLTYAVLTTASAITKSLEYVVEVSNSITKSLKYAVIATPSAVTKSLQYVIETTPSAITKSLTYDVGSVYGTQISDSALADDASLVAYWRFESDGTDETSNNNDLTGYNTPVHSAGKFGDAVDFELSSSQRYEISDGSQTGLDFNSDFTFAAWIKLEQLPSVAGTDFFIVAKDSVGTSRSWGWFIRTSNDTINATYLDSSSNQSRSYMDLVFDSSDVGEWVHVAVAYDISAKTAVWYKNGVEQTDTVDLSAASSINNSTAPVTVGSRYVSGSPSGFFDGMIDDLAIFTRLLTEDEIRGLAKSRIGITKSMQYTVVASPAAVTKSLTYTVETTASAITKSLIYAVITAVSAITKSLTYTVVASATAITKSLQYVVTATPSAVTKSLTYVVDFSSAVTITKSMRYVLDAQEVQITKSMSYHVKVGIYTDKYIVQNTSYSDKYSDQGNTYSDKYSVQGTTYTDKYT